jgi:hypothetical protein
MRKPRTAYRLLAGNQKGKRPPGRQSYRWTDNIKMNLIDVGFDGVDWIIGTIGGLL